MNDAELKSKLIVQLLKRAIEVEANEANVMFRTYLAEEDKKKKSVIFQIYKESELHRLILEDLLLFLGEDPQTQRSLKEYDIEDLFGHERLYVLRKVEEMARDLYKDILREMETLNEEDKGSKMEKVMEVISKLLEWEKKHTKMIESLHP
jgi:hypothetical protein